MGIPITPDHEIIKEALEKIVELIAENEKEVREFSKAELFNQAIIYNRQNDELKKIKKILELSVNFQLKHKPDWSDYVMEE